MSEDAVDAIRDLTKAINRLVESNSLSQLTEAIQSLKHLEDSLPNIASAIGDLEQTISRKS